MPHEVLLVNVQLDRLARGPLRQAEQLNVPLVLLEPKVPPVAKLVLENLDGAVNIFENVNQNVQRLLLVVDVKIEVQLQPEEEEESGNLIAEPALREVGNN